MGKKGRKERPSAGAAQGSDQAGLSRMVEGMRSRRPEGVSPAGQKFWMDIEMLHNVLDGMSPGTDVQEVTEDCLNCIASQGFLGGVEARRMVVRWREDEPDWRMGGIAAVLKAMRRFEDNAYVTELGVQAFGNLCRFELDVATRVVEGGGIKAVAKAMLRYTDHSGVQTHSIWVLECLSQWRDLCPHIIEAGGLRPIILCIRKSLRSASEWVRKCCDILTKVCLSATDAAPLVLSEGGQRACFTALRIHGSEPAVLASCNALLDALLAGVPPAEQAEIRAKRAAVLVETCAMCGAGAGQNHMKNLLACGSCSLAVKYCSKECQLKDWPSHTLECKVNRKCNAPAIAPAQGDKPAKKAGGAAESPPKQIVPAIDGHSLSPPLFLSIAAEGKAHWQKGAHEGMPWARDGTPASNAGAAQAPPSEKDLD